MSRTQTWGDISVVAPHQSAGTVVGPGMVPSGELVPATVLLAAQAGAGPTTLRVEGVKPLNPPVEAKRPDLSASESAKGSTDVASAPMTASPAHAVSDRPVARAQSLKRTRRACGLPCSSAAPTRTPPPGFALPAFGRWSRLRWRVRSGCVGSWFCLRRRTVQLARYRELAGGGLYAPLPLC